MNEPRRDERGYAMMATLWFTLLAAALSAVLLAHAMKGVRQVGRERSAWRQQLAIDNAIERALADRLVDGSITLSSLPLDRAEQAEQVQVTIAPEATLIDVETARLDDVISALASVEVPAETSQILAAGLTGPNSRAATLGDIARRIEAISDDPQALCALLVLSPQGGATLQPELSVDLAAGASVVASRASGPLRIVARHQTAVLFETVVRQNFTAEPYSVVDRLVIQRPLRCSELGGADMIVP